jgi:ubiquinone/menaquinone biosynthesis C-methylase UbiE
MPTNDAALAQHARVQAQFGKSARSYLASPNHAKGDELQAMLELAAPVSGLEVLDVATGAGHTAITFAEAGAEVTATDITPEMLEVTR